MTARDYNNWANDWRNLSKKQIKAILKANSGLINHLDLLILNIERILSEYQTELREIILRTPELAANPIKAEQFIKNALADSGYPELKSILENILHNDETNQVEEKAETQKPLGEFVKILQNVKVFQQAEAILTNDGYFGVNMTVSQLAAWGLYLNDYKITIETKTRPGGFKGDFNFSRLNESLITRYVDGVKRTKKITLESLNNNLGDGKERRKALNSKVTIIENLLAEKGIQSLKKHS